MLLSIEVYINSSRHAVMYIIMIMIMIIITIIIIIIIIIYYLSGN